MTESAAPLRGWLLYDASCGICIRLIRLVNGVFVRRGLGAEALQAEWVKVRCALDDDVLVKDFRLLLADGARLDGADAYRFLFKSVWWMSPLYLFSILPGCRFLFDKAYRIIADNRWRISKACGLTFHVPGNSRTNARP